MVINESFIPPKNNEQEKGVSTVTFAIVVCTILILFVVIAAYVIIMDKLNANDAYRFRELIEQRNGLKVACDENYRNLAQTQELLKRHIEITPPLDIMTSRQCPLIQPIEKPTEH